MTDRPKEVVFLYRKEQMSIMSYGEGQTPQRESLPSNESSEERITVAEMNQPTLPVAISKRTFAETSRLKG